METSLFDYNKYFLYLANSEDDIFYFYGKMLLGDPPNYPTITQYYKNCPKKFKFYKFKYLCILKASHYLIPLKSGDLFN